jgi:hypothetical protein
MRVFKNERNMFSGYGIGTVVGSFEHVDEISEISGRLEVSS